MADLNDFGELYADLEDRLIVGVPTAEAEEEDKNEMDERGAGHENDSTVRGSCSESEDDLQIVLNEEDYTNNKFSAQLLAERRDYEEDEGDDLFMLTGSDCFGKEPNWPEQAHSADGLPQDNGDRGNATKGVHRKWSRSSLVGSAVRALNSLPGRSHCDHLTVQCSLGKTLYNSGFPMAVSNGCDFYLPLNRTIFSIDLESFEHKPWRFSGVDITDYFNFAFDEEGWRNYCNQLVHFQQNKLPLHESSKWNKPTGTMSGEVAQYRCDNRHEILDYLNNGRKGIIMPKGQAIQVENCSGERIPSIDVRRPRNRDSDVVIQITTGLAVEDAVDSMISTITDTNDSGSKNDLPLNFKNELCKSSFNLGTHSRKSKGSSNSSKLPHPYLKKPFNEKLDIMNCGRDFHSSIMPLSKPDAIIAHHYSSSPKSSDHKGSFKANREEVVLDKIPSPDCFHLNCDSLLQESVLSHCYPSSETGSDTNKTVRTSCGIQSTESLPDLNHCEQTTPRKVVELNLSSDDEIDLPLVHGLKIDSEHQPKESGTIVGQWDDEPDERIHSSQGGKISLKSSIKYNNGKEVNANDFLAHLKCTEDRSAARYSEKRTTEREVKRRKNGFYNNQKAQHNSSAHDMVIGNYLQSTSQNTSLYDKMVGRTSRRLDGLGPSMRVHYNSIEAEDQQRKISSDEYREKSERSLDNYFGRYVSFFKEEEESFIDKYDRVSCSSGALRRFHVLDSHGKAHEGSRLYEDGLYLRIYREAFDDKKRGWHEDGSHRNQVPSLSSLYRSDKRTTCHNGFSRTRETFSQPRSKQDMITSKTSHLFSRAGINLDDDHFPVIVRKTYPNTFAYNEKRKSGLALSELLAKEEANIRHQDSNNISSPKRCTLHGTKLLQNGRVDKNSLSKQKFCDNHLHKSRGNKLTIKSGKDADSGGCVGSISDNFVKDRRELDNRGYMQVVSKHLNGLKVKDVVNLSLKVERQQLAQKKIFSRPLVLDQPYNRLKGNKEPLSKGASSSRGNSENTQFAHEGTANSYTMHKCFKCYGFGHITTECQTRKVITFIEEMESEEEINVKENENLIEETFVSADDGEYLVIRCLLTYSKEEWLRHSIFRI